MGLLAGLLKHFFAEGEGGDFLRGEELEVEEEAMAKLVASLAVARNPGGLKYLIHTSPGEGPQILQVSRRLHPQLH